MKYISVFILTFCIGIPLIAQKNQPFQHVEPPFWWIGMKNKSVQILFYNKTAIISEYQVSLKYEGVQIQKTAKVSNPHYLFVTLDITPTAKAGTLSLEFALGKKKLLYQYELRNKDTSPGRIQGFNSSDVVYLIMPDRFANGDLKNDTLRMMLEGTHREKPESRHGGDLKGISDHLDYIKDLGVTAVWLNPVLENNQPKSSYHGYAITDLYQVDRRFGSNEDYLAFIDKSHQMGLKVIQDMVMNHLGSYHWIVKDLPEKTWLNQFPEFTRSNYQSSVVSDPYQSSFDSNLMSNGWFDTTMPDVNQSDSVFATYLIQNTLWWIEYAGIDGIRMDTYPYPDKTFMSKWVKEVMHEYPRFNVVGEVWIDNIATTAYWQKGAKNKDGYESNLPSVTDFPLCFAIPKALNEPATWENGMRRLYNIIAQDFAYPDPNNNLIFLDNHDMSRIFLSLGKDINKLKMALVLLLTTRGIPEIYYGTELLMDGDGGYHPNVRKDFPGGWLGDQSNAFTSAGRTKEQNEMQVYMKKIMDWRKSQPVIHSGKLTHYIPEDNIYVYFRHNQEKTVMVVLNANNSQKQINTAKFKDHIKSKSAINIISGEKNPDISTVYLKPWEAAILEID